MISRVSKRDVRVHEYLTKPAFWRYDSMNVDDSYGIIIPLMYPMVIDLTLEVTKRDLILCYMKYYAVVKPGVVLYNMSLKQCMDFQDCDNKFEIK